MQETEKIDVSDNGIATTEEKPREIRRDRPGERRLSSAEEIGKLPRFRLPNEQWTSEEIIVALHANKGGMYLAAEQLGCTYQCIWDRSKVDPAVMEVIRHYRGSLVDKAEGKLLEAVERGDAWATQFTLKTLGKRRGYVERVETRNRTRIKGAMVSFLAPTQLTGLLGAEPPAELPSNDPPALPPPTE